jgi:hypothetical protein
MSFIYSVLISCIISIIVIEILSFEMYKKHINKQSLMVIFITTLIINLTLFL